VHAGEKLQPRLRSGSRRAHEAHLSETKKRECYETDLGKKKKSACAPQAVEGRVPT
jgi:hypothetical protein